MLAGGRGSCGPQKSTVFIVFIVTFGRKGGGSGPDAPVSAPGNQYVLDTCSGVASVGGQLAPPQQHSGENGVKEGNGRKDKIVVMGKLMGPLPPPPQENKFLTTPLDT